MLHSKFKLYLALIPNLLRIQVSAQKIEYLLQLSLFYVKPTISLLKTMTINGTVMVSGYNL